MSETLEIYISSKYEPLGIPDSSIELETQIFEEMFNISFNMHGSVRAIDTFLQTETFSIFSIDKNLRILKAMDKMMTPKLLAKNIYPIGIELHDRGRARHPSRHCKHPSSSTDCEFCIVREFLVVFKISVKRSKKFTSAEYLNNRELESFSIKECADIIALETTAKGIDWNVVGLGDLKVNTESFIRLSIENSHDFPPRLTF